MGGEEKMNELNELVICPNCGWEGKLSLGEDCPKCGYPVWDGFDKQAVEELDGGVLGW